MTSHPRWKAFLWALIFLGMIAMGLLANRRPPPPSAHDPQNVIQLFRDGVPRELLVMLPLRAGDQLRLVGLAPSEMKPALFWIDPSGHCRELAPFGHRQVGGSVRQIDYPPMESMPCPTQPGWHIVLLAADLREQPTLAGVAAGWANQTLPPPPSKYLMMLFTRERVELLHPKGFPLPAVDATQPMVDDLKRAIQRLSQQFAFVSGTIVPVK